MGELANRLNMLSVEVHSPDGGLTAVVSGRDEIRVGFAWGAYPKYRSSALSRQLESLASLAWVSYRRAYLEIEAAWADHDEEPARTAEDHDFQRRMEELTVAASSMHGWVTVRSRALVSWHVEMADEPVGSLTEQEFLAELNSAVAALLADYRAKLVVLTDAVYDIGLPRSMRIAGSGVS